MPSSRECARQHRFARQTVIEPQSSHQPGRLAPELYNARRLAESSRWLRNVATLKKVTSPPPFQRAADMVGPIHPRLSPRNDLSAPLDPNRPFHDMRTWWPPKRMD